MQVTATGIKAFQPFVVEIKVETQQDAYLLRETCARAIWYETTNPTASKEPTELARKISSFIGAAA
jgi:hypothetical protein